MTQYIVTFTSMIIDAESADDAIDRAGEFKGGGNWEAEEVAPPASATAHWAARRRDDGAIIGRFDDEREGRRWINERTMPWEFDLVDLSAPSPTNLDDAIEFATRLSNLNLVRSTLIGIFARRELEGGRAAAADHPLMKQIEAEKAVLEEQIILLV